MTKNDYLEVLFTKDEIDKKVSELSKIISKDYKDKNLVCIGVLNGAYAFYSDLVRCLDIPAEVDFIRAKSYVGETSAGNVDIHLDMKNSIKGKDVLVVEDILDTGRTLSEIKKKLLEQNPNSVKFAVFLDKPSRRIKGFEADYKCFEIDDLFVVGYGLDFDEQYRNLPFVAVYKG